MSTLNSFLFLSGTTIGRDFIYRLNKKTNERFLKKYTILGLLLSGIISILIAYQIPSVINIWYTIGSLCIPGMILPVISAYYTKFRIENKLIFAEMILAVLTSIIWYFLRDSFNDYVFLSLIEPMIVGLITAVLIHSIGLFRRRFLFKMESNIDPAIKNIITTREISVGIW